MTPRILTPEDWRTQAGAFIALWTDAAYAYALFAPGTLSAVAMTDGAYQALSPNHPGAAWFERLAQDQNSHTPIGAAASRRAVLHAADANGRGVWPEFTLAPGIGVHAFAAGPVPSGINEPAHFHFSIRGETVLKLETRLRYTHRGIIALIRGKSPRLAARFAARVCGDATVAHSLAFAHAAEAALDTPPPPRAIYLRAVMAELERIATHAGVLGDVARLADLPLAAARLFVIRETVTITALTAFGHRLMMDIVIPGGIAGDLRSEGAASIAAALASIESELPELTRIFATGACLQDRLSGLGVTSPLCAVAFAAPGPTGRAAGRVADARQTPGYAPYETLELSIPSASAGDAAARAKILLAELAESIRLIHRLLHGLPEGKIAIAPPAGTGAGLGVAESCRGPVWHWLNIDAGAITDVFIADPSSLLFPMLEHAATTASLDDFPLVLASINPSPAGADL